MFVDANSKIDREGLRLYVLERLEKFHHLALVICSEKKSAWQRIEYAAKQSLPTHEQPKAVGAVKQLISLPEYIKGWINVAVDSQERFEFFIANKANELKSGDQQRDYFWALQIRHDQLIALVKVLEILVAKMQQWIDIRPDQVFDDPVFAGLTEFGIEDQVYIEAEKVYKERVRIMQQTV